MREPSRREESLRFHIGQSPRGIAKRQEAIAEQRAKLREEKARKRERWDKGKTLNPGSLQRNLEQHFSGVVGGPVTVIVPPEKIPVTPGYGFQVVVVRESDWKRSGSRVIVADDGGVQLYPRELWLDTGAAPAATLADYATEMAAWEAASEAQLGGLKLAQAGAAFNSALLHHLTRDLGVGRVMREFEAQDELPVPSGPFSCRVVVDGAPDLVVDCKHSGDGMITFSLGSRRARFRPEAPDEPPQAMLEFVEGTPEGDPRWDLLNDLSARRRAGMAEDDWRREVASAVGVSLEFGPETEAAVERYQAAITAAGFDEERLMETGREIEADPAVPVFLEEELYSQIRVRMPN